MGFPGTPEGRRFRGEMSWGPGKGRLEIQGRTACDCGCGLPARVEIRVDDRTIFLDDPDLIDLAIATLVEARGKLWPPESPASPGAAPDPGEAEGGERDGD